MSAVSFARAAQSYARFEHWVHASALELYKPALTPLLFPVFAHCVLALCRAGAARAEEEEAGAGSGDACGEGVNGTPVRRVFGD